MNETSSKENVLYTEGANPSVTVTYAHIVDKRAPFY